MAVISIIVPVYNVEKYINRCIDSILSQSFTDFELILVDDGSPDNCGKICDDYAIKDSRVIVIHKENGGQSSARNIGLDKATGDWIAFIDSDDWVMPDYLEVLYYSAINNNADISACSSEDVIEYKSTFIEGCTSLIKPEKFWLDNTTLATVPWGKLYKSSLWKEKRFPPIKIMEDEYVIYLLIFSCDFIAFNNSDLYKYFKNPNGVMSGAGKISFIKIEALKQQIEFFHLHKFDNACCERSKYLLTYVYECLTVYSHEKKKIKKLKKIFKYCLDNYFDYTGWNRDDFDFYFVLVYPFKIKFKSYL